MVKTWFIVSSSSIAHFPISNFVCKVNNILQNKLEVKEGEVEELGALKQNLIVKEQNADN